MKIAMVTIHNANNYGAIFQAYATQKVISTFGNVEILNYENRHVSRSFDLIRLKPTFHGLLGAGKDVLRLFPRYRVIAKFRKFICDNFNQTQLYSREDILNDLLPRYDAYVAGSDQIWNPACVDQRCQLDPVYFLDFAPDKSRKISYASSMGGHCYSGEEKQQVKNFLQTFDAISVREKNAKTALQDLMGRHIEQVLDPTLLLASEEWLSICGSNSGYRPEEKYIILYTVPKVPLIRHAVEFFANKLGLKVISISQGLSSGAKVDKCIRDAGPEEFLNLFANAEFVITDSFHGTCFSLIFSKPFVAISNKQYSNRIQSLLEIVGLGDRLVTEKAYFDQLDLTVDFENVHKKLSSAKSKSIEFIDKSLRSN